MKRIGLNTSAKRKSINKVRLKNETERDPVIDDGKEPLRKRKDGKSKSNKNLPLKR